MAADFYIHSAVAEISDELGQAWFKLKGCQCIVV